MGTGTSLLRDVGLDRPLVLERMQRALVVVKLTQTKLRTATPGTLN